MVDRIGMTNAKQLDNESGKKLIILVVRPIITAKNVITYSTSSPSRKYK